MDTCTNARDNEPGARYKIRWEKSGISKRMAGADGTIASLTTREVERVTQGCGGCTYAACRAARLSSRYNNTRTASQRFHFNFYPFVLTEYSGLPEGILLDIDQHRLHESAYCPSYKRGRSSYLVVRLVLVFGGSSRRSSPYINEEAGAQSRVCRRFHLKHLVKAWCVGLS